MTETEIMGVLRPMFARLIPERSGHHSARDCAAHAAMALSVYLPEDGAPEAILAHYIDRAKTAPHPGEPAPPTFTDEERNALAAEALKALRTAGWDK